MNIENHMNVVEEMIKTVAKDRRDEWPDNSKSYIKGKFLIIYRILNFKFDYLKVSC